MDFIVEPKSGVPPVIVGGWGSSAGVRMIRPGVRGTILAEFGENCPFTRLLTVPEGSEAMTLLVSARAYMCMHVRISVCVFLL